MCMYAYTSLSVSLWRRLDAALRCNLSACRDMPSTYIPCTVCTATSTYDLCWVPSSEEIFFSLACLPFFLSPSALLVFSPLLAFSLLLLALHPPHEVFYEETVALFEAVSDMLFLNGLPTYRDSKLLIHIARQTERGRQTERDRESCSRVRTGMARPHM